MKSAFQRAAPAMCKLDGHPEDAKMEGKPLWQDYLPEVRTVLAAIRNPSAAMIDLYDGPVGEAGWDMDKRKAVFVKSTWNGLIDAALLEGEP